MTESPTRPAAATWQMARIIDIHDENHRTRTYRLRLEHPSPHLAGQHYVVRLTAPDGYTASRSYSVATPPAGAGSAGTPEIELTVEHLEDGEVSGYLHDVAMVGDEFEVRGPIGRWFVWRGDTPALLVGGGSGLVPLMSMVRFARNRGREDLVRLVASVRGPEDLLYADEIGGPSTTIVYSRTTPEGWPRPPGRMTADDLEPLIEPTATVYVCGSARFADGATEILIGLGVEAERIRVERFGPSA